MTIIPAIWNVLCQLAPWLLLGMFLSGMLHVLLPAGFVRQRFRGTQGVLSAVTLGIPLPLCSCGVVPAGIGLKNEGASDGAAIGFLISTPQTGIDSILVSASFFGWPFAIFKMAAALVTGVLGGLFADRTENPGESSKTSSTNVQADQKPKRWSDLFVHGIDILRSIWGWLIVGIVVSAVIENWVPESWIAGVGSMNLFWSMLLVLAVSTPLYVCATASVPIAAALVSAGLPPAAALVFLMAGPATNVTTIGAIFSRFGGKQLAIYLSSIIGGSMLFAWMFDWVVTTTLASGHSHAHDHNNWISILSAVILLGLIGWFVWESVQRRLSTLSMQTPAREESGSGMSPAHQQKENGGQFQEFQAFQVDGLHCQNCVSKLERALRDLPGLTKAQVQLKNGTVVVAGEFTSDEIKATISSAGFIPL